MINLMSDLRNIRNFSLIILESDTLKNSLNENRVRRAKKRKRMYLCNFRCFASWIPKAISSIPGKYLTRRGTPSHSVRFQYNYKTEGKVSFKVEIIRTRTVRCISLQPKRTISPVSSKTACCVYHVSPINPFFSSVSEIR